MSDPGDETKYVPDRPDLFMPMPEPIIEEFDVLKIGAQTLIARELLKEFWPNKPQVDISENALFNHIVVRAVYHLLARKAREEVVTGTEHVPASWFDHVKAAIACWGLKGQGEIVKGYGWRWKVFKTVRTRDITTHTTVYNTCPHIHIPDYPDRARALHLRFLMDADNAAQQEFLRRAR